MPWSVKKDSRCPAAKPWGLVKQDDNSLEGCHVTEAQAKKQQAALYANEAAMPPPRDNLIRAQSSALRLVEDKEKPDAIGTLVGHFAVFEEWAEIDSVWEGRFLERIMPGAFTKTFSENRDRMRVTFQHGQDPHIGDKPLGPIADLKEDDTGGYYEVPLLDTSYNRDLVPGLEKGLYGSSFRFRVLKEELDLKPKVRDYNPEGLPERTIREAHVFEFGPVTYPAYVGAEAGVRSLTDQFITTALASDPERLRALLAAVPSIALPPDGAGSDHSDEGSRTVYPMLTLDEFLEELTPHA